MTALQAAMVSLDCFGHPLYIIDFLSLLSPISLSRLRHASYLVNKNLQKRPSLSLLQEVSVSSSCVCVRVVDCGEKETNMCAYHRKEEIGPKCSPQREE